jgi:hypothetical protein
MISMEGRIRPENGLDDRVAGDGLSAVARFHIV